MKANNKFTMSIVSLVTLCIFGYYIYTYISNIPKKVTEYENVKLGMGMDELIYNLGYPPEVLYEEQNPLISGIRFDLRLATKEEVLQKKNGERDFFYWQYPSKEKDNKRIDIEFDKQTRKVTSIGCYVSTEAFTYPGTCKINGIQALDNEETIISTLGTPSSDKLDGITKIITYKKLNMEIFLEKRYAYHIKAKKFN